MKKFATMAGVGALVLTLGLGAPFAQQQSGSSAVSTQTKQTTQAETEKDKAPTAKPTADVKTEKSAPATVKPAPTGHEKHMKDAKTTETAKEPAKPTSHVTKDAASMDKAALDKPAVKPVPEAAATRGKADTAPEVKSTDKPKDVKTDKPAETTAGAKPAVKQ